MLTRVADVITVDASKLHHWLVVQSAKHGLVHVTCVDCDESREYPFSHLDKLVEWLELQEDIQVLSWVVTDVG